MEALKTPYLDNAIESTQSFLIINYSEYTKNKLQEYQQIKAALKRLEELEEVLSQFKQTHETFIAKVESGQARSKRTYFQMKLDLETLKTVLEK